MLGSDLLQKTGGRDLYPRILLPQPQDLSLHQSVLPSLVPGQLQLCDKANVPQSHLFFICQQTNQAERGGTIFTLFNPLGYWFRNSSAQNDFGPDVSAHYSIRDCSAHFSGTARPILIFYLFILLFIFGGGIYCFIIYKVVKYRKILLIYNVYFIFSLVKI